ncbi:hypothetical protein pb186bvf_004813 [Paramecium bursaria]
MITPKQNQENQIDQSIVLFSILINMKIFRISIFELIQEVFTSIKNLKVSLQKEQMNDFIFVFAKNDGISAIKEGNQQSIHFNYHLQADFIFKLARNQLILTNSNLEKYVFTFLHFYFDYVEFFIERFHKMIYLGPQNLLIQDKYFFLFFSTMYDCSSQLNSFRRVKERNVQDALEKVSLWRKLFDDGIIDGNGEVQKITLNKAAELVGIPKKTLEDYTQLFKKVKLLTDPYLFADKKMGFLRNYLRKNQSKLKKALKLEKARELRNAEHKNSPHHSHSDTNQIMNEFPEVYTYEQELYQDFFEDSQPYP